MPLNKNLFGVELVLMVEDIGRSIYHYTHRLQFRLVGRIGDEFAWLQLSGDDERHTHVAAVNIFLQNQSRIYVKSHLATTF